GRRLRLCGPRVVGEQSPPLPVEERVLPAPFRIEPVADFHAGLVERACPLLPGGTRSPTDGLQMLECRLPLVVDGFLVEELDREPLQEHTRGWDGLRQESGV